MFSAIGTLTVPAAVKISIIRQISSDMHPHICNLHRNMCHCLPFGKLPIKMIPFYQFNSRKILSQTEMKWYSKVSSYDTTSGMGDILYRSSNKVWGGSIFYELTLNITQNISLPSCLSLSQASHGISFLCNLEGYFVHTRT